MGQLDHPTHNACYTEKSREEMGVFQYDVRNTVSPDDLHRPVQVPEKPGFQMGGNHHKKHTSIKSFRSIGGFCLENKGIIQ